MYLNIFYTHYNTKYLWEMYSLVMLSLLGSWLQKKKNKRPNNNYWKAKQIIKIKINNLITFRVLRPRQQFKSAII